MALQHAALPRRARNDPRQYDDLAGEWWKPRGAFVALHWLAAARARLVPPPRRAGAVLVDVACGGGLLAPHVAGTGYRHVGVDLRPSAARIAREHGVVPAVGDAHRLPLRDGSADVVVAGEIFEHVGDLEAVVAEIARILRPGGVLVFDTLADTWRCRFLLVTVGERLPFVPAGIHDPSLFVAPERLQSLAEAHGLTLELQGIRPSIPQALGWLLGRRDDVAMRPTRSTRMVYHGIGVKRGG